MKFCSMSITLFLLLGLRSGYSSSTGKIGWTVIPSLKDGFDIVFSFENTTLFSHQSFKENYGHTFDIHLRKSSQDDPNKFVVHLENVQLQEKIDNPPTDTDLDALLLPIIVKVKNDEMEFDVYASETDTWNSLNWKYWTLIMLFHNHKPEIKRLQSSGLLSKERSVRGMAFGYCKATFNLIKGNGEVGLEIVTTRDKCTNESHNELQNTFLGRICKFHATDIQERSEFKIGFYYDARTFQFLRSTDTKQGKLINEDNTSFFLKTEVKFNSFKEITDVFDETKNTKMYKYEDF